jgi:hypothetical protein
MDREFACMERGFGVGPTWGCHFFLFIQSVPAMLDQGLPAALNKTPEML